MIEKNDLITQTLYDLTVEAIRHGHDIEVRSGKDCLKVYEVSKKKILDIPSVKAVTEKD